MYGEYLWLPMITTEYHEYPILACVACPFHRPSRHYEWIPMSMITMITDVRSIVWFGIIIEYQRVPMITREYHEYPIWACVACPFHRPSCHYQRIPMITYDYQGLPMITMITDVRSYFELFHTLGPDWHWQFRDRERDTKSVSFWFPCWEFILNKFLAIHNRFFWKIRMITCDYHEYR